MAIFCCGLLRPFSFIISGNHHTLTHIHRLLQPYPSESPVWNDDRIDDHPVYWNAFDVLTNLCKWESVRLDLIKAGVVKFLDVLAKKDNYFGFEATGKFICADNIFDRN